MKQSTAHGFSMLELLFALAIFSAGLLGILQLQLHTHLQLQNKLYTARATQHAYQFSAWLSAFALSPDSLDARILEAQWQQAQRHLFPAPGSAVRIDADKTIITVSWHDPIAKDAVCGEQRSCIHMQRE